MGKKHTDENFPVGSFLIKKELRPVVMSYYQFARKADDIADRPSFSKEEKLKKLDEMEKELYDRNKGIGKLFKEMNLSYSLAADLLTAFRQDAKGFEYHSWEQLVDYCKYSAVPVGRFMLAIHDESISTYQSAAAVCTALQIINHIQDMKDDLINLNRVYIPSDMMKKHGVSTDNLKAEQMSEGFRKLVDEMLFNVQGMIKDGSECIRFIKSFSLRGEVAVTAALAEILIAKLKKKNILAHKIKLTKFEWLRGILTGILQAVMPNVFRP